LLRRRDVASGILLGLGAATKIYPAIFVIPFAAERLREGRRRDAIRLVAAAAATWLVVDLPFMVLVFHRWSYVFRFTSERRLGWASLWFVGCYRVSHSIACGMRHIRAYDVLSIVAFVAVAAAVWAIRIRRRPDTPRWMMAFPFVAALLLTNKVYSPQYSLWLIPWFAVALPDLRLFLAFEVTDLAVFVTGFAWNGHRRASELGYPGGWVNHVGIGLDHIALVARAAVLVALLVAFARGRGADRTLERTRAGPVPPAERPSFAPLALIRQACSALVSWPGWRSPPGPSRRGAGALASASVCACRPTAGSPSAGSSPTTSPGGTSSCGASPMRRTDPSPAHRLRRLRSLRSLHRTKPNRTSINTTRMGTNRSATIRGASERSASSDHSPRVDSI
jgi:hypothetical protein